MRRTMRGVSVSTDKAERSIRIAQQTDDPNLDGNNEIFLTPEQIPTVVAWLQEAAKEIESE